MLRATLVVMATSALLSCRSTGQLSAICSGSKSVTLPASIVLPGYVVKLDSARRVVVFVHGPGGNARDSWTAANGTYWPLLLHQDPTFADFDVYVYQYATRPLGECMSVSDVADDMRLRLDADRVFEQHDQVLFVAHSMGGLVVRQFLVRNREQLTDKVPLVYFYATPTAGARKANLATLLTRCSQVEDLRLLNANSYLKAQQSDWLSANLHEKLMSYCAFETLGTTVDRSSATLLCSKPPVASGCRSLGRK